MNIVKFESKLYVLVDGKMFYYNLLRFYLWCIAFGKFCVIIGMKVCLMIKFVGDLPLWSRFLLLSCISFLLRTLSLVVVSTFRTLVWSRRVWVSAMFVCSYVLFGSFCGKSQVGECTFSEGVVLMLVVCSVVFWW